MGVFFLIISLEIAKKEFHHKKIQLKFKKWVLFFLQGTQILELILFANSCRYTYNTAYLFKRKYLFLYFDWIADDEPDSA